MTHQTPHDLPEDPMTRPMPEPAPPYRQIIATALEDWWVTADPAAPFNPAEVAEQVDTYLLGSGYTISHGARTPTPPSRAHVTFTALLALICLIAAAASFAHLYWVWAAAGLVGAVIFTNELVDELEERRRGRRT